MALDPVQPRRVVVTGLGVACGLGLEAEELWTGLLDGRCGIRPLELISADSPLPGRVAGTIHEGALERALERYGIRDPDRPTRLGLYAAGRALEDAALPTDGRAALDYALVAGSGHGGVISDHEAHEAWRSGGYRKLRPTAVLRGMFNRPASRISIRYRLTGASYAVGAACASGSIAFGEAFYMVRFGRAAGAVAACSDAGLDPTTLAAWNRLGVLSPIREPERACRPFDRGRQGIVPGEGAAAFVLEPLDAAERRGAPILAEVTGYGCTSDATHIVQPHAAGQTRAIREALACAGITPDDVDYVNAHGTATELADVVEAESLRAALGARADSVPVSTTKSQLGHLMGATAGVELAATILALQRGVLPPCRNLEDPDPRCELAFVRGAPRAQRITVAMKTSFAFGGTNSVVVLRRCQTQMSDYLG